jgi:polyisoprenoid-binding protein YceI
MPSSKMTEPALQALRDGRLAGTWTLDPARSQVGLRTKSMWGLVKVNGVFRRVTGAGVITAGGDVTGTITVGAASIDTKNKRRDDHLRSADFFQASDYPDITFTVDRITQAGQDATVRGILTVRGTTLPLSFPAAVSNLGGDELWLDAQVTVNRGDFGLTWNQMGMASMDNTIAIHAVFAKKALQ